MRNVISIKLISVKSKGKVISECVAACMVLTFVTQHDQKEWCFSLPWQHIPLQVNLNRDFSEVYLMEIDYYVGRAASHFKPE